MICALREEEMEGKKHGVETREIGLEIDKKKISVRYQGVRAGPCRKNVALKGE